MPGSMPPSTTKRAELLAALPQDRWTTAYEIATLLHYDPRYVRRCLNSMVNDLQIKGKIGQYGGPGYRNLYRRLPEKVFCKQCQQWHPESDFYRDYRTDELRYYSGCRNCRRRRDQAARLKLDDKETRDPSWTRPSKAGDVSPAAKAGASVS